MLFRSGMVISACSTVLIPLFSKNIHEKSNPSITIFPVWNSVFCKTVKLIYPLVLFSFVYSDEIMIFLYGNQYLISGNYFKIKLIVNLFTLISYYPLIIAINANSFYAKVHILHAIILISLDYISASLLASSYAVAFSSVLCRIINISVLLYYLSRYFGIKLTDMIPFSLIAKILIPSLIILYSIKIISKIYITDNLLLLIIGMLLYFIVYFIWSFISKIDYISILRPIIKIK